MSLIRDALREMGSAENPAPVSLGRHAVVSSETKGSLRWFVGVIGLLGFLAIAGVGWLFLSHTPAPRYTPPLENVAASKQSVSPSNTAASSQTPPSPIVTDGDASLGAESNTHAHAHAQSKLQEQIQPKLDQNVVIAQERLQDSVPANVIPSGQRSTTVNLNEKSSARMHSVRNERRTSPHRTATVTSPSVRTDVPVVEAASLPPVETTYALLNQALANNDLKVAREQLTLLEQILPAESLTLLRARAWFQMRTQDVASARATYQFILDRLPGDENAGLNLATIEAAAGHVETARQLLSKVLQENPDSLPARQALVRLGVASSEPKPIRP